MGGGIVRGGGGPPVQVISLVLLQLVPGVSAGGVAHLVLGLDRVVGGGGAGSALRPPAPLLLVLGGLPDAVRCRLLLLPLRGGALAAHGRADVLVQGLRTTAVGAVRVRAFTRRNWGVWGVEILRVIY